MQIYLFNPDNDLALASDSPYFQPPARIRRMMDELACLPFWYAEPDNAILVPYGMGERMEQMYPHIASMQQMRWVERPVEGVYCPWGWNRALLHQLNRQGVSGLPSVEWIRTIRLASSRETARELLYLLNNLPGMVGESEVCHSLAEVEQRLARGARWILKAPWSGSGKGLLRTSVNEWNTHAQGWTARILRTQQAVMMEPLYEKEVDFAFEYTVHDGQAAFKGYSLFETDVHGYYKGNVLVSDAFIEAQLIETIGTEALAFIKERQAAFITAQVGTFYEGCVGVDAMLIRQEGKIRCQPCIEMNLRTTMGWVCHQLFDRWIDPQARGVFRLIYARRPGEIKEWHDKCLSESPPVWYNGRLTKGYLPLVPVDENNVFLAYVLI